MGLDERVRRLEQRAGCHTDGACPHGVDLRIYDKDDDGGYSIHDKPAEADRTPAKVCQVCGREQRRISIVLVKGRDAHDALETE